VAVHEIPPALSQVETVFVRRVDSHFSSALATFLESVHRETETHAQNVRQLA
jgi:hypothetical protein